MRRKRLAVIIGALGAIFFFMAAGELFAGGSKEAASSAGASASVTTLQLDVTPPGDTKNADFAPILAKFESQNPGVKVKVQTIPFASYDSSIETAIRGGGGPDLMEVNFVDLGTWHAAGFLTDISSKMAAAGISADRYNPGFYKDGSIGGGQYGFPLDQDSRCVYYNKAIFDKYGLQPPKTWDDILSISKVLKQHDIYGLALQMDNPWGAVWEVSGNLLVANNGRVLNEAGTKAIAATDPGTIQTYTFLLDTMRPYYPPGISTMDGKTISSLFAGGKLGMYIGGPWVADNLKADNPDMVFGKGFGIALNPVAPGTQKTGAAGGGFFLGMNAKGSSQDQAWKLMQVLTDKSNAKFWAQYHGGFPVWRGSADQAPWGTDPFYAAFIAQLPTTASPVLPLSPQLPTIVQNLYKQMQQIVTGSKTVAQGLADFDTQTNAILGQ